MSDLQAFLGRLIKALEDAQIPYMLAGSFASTYHGTPRTTQDVDIVVELTPQGLERLLALLSPDEYYLSEDDARDALKRRAMFNIIDLDSAWKADLIVRKNRPFSREEFQRKERANVLGVDVWMASAEDTIISKLVWATDSESERQLNDVRGVLQTKAGELDLTYIERWVSELRLDAAWHKVRP